MIEDFDINLFKKCKPLFSDRPVIFDIGAHKGAYTDFVLQEIPSADCYLFEPNPALFEALKHRKNSFNYAINNLYGDQDFYKCPSKNDELSSLHKRPIFDETGFERITVPTTYIDKFCIAESIEEVDFIKVDVEGSEISVVAGAKNMMALKKVKFIQVEYGGTYIDAGVQFSDLINLSNDLEYKVYELAGNKLSEVTKENFVNDYRYSIFLLTYLDLSCL